MKNREQISGKLSYIRYTYDFIRKRLTKTETAPSDLKKGEYLLTVTVYTGNYELYFNGMIPPIDKETQFVCSYRFLAICVVK